MSERDKLIQQLKKDLRKAVFYYRSIANDCSCGAAMLQHISSDAGALARKCDEILDELALLDPACPTMRFAR